MELPPWRPFRWSFPEPRNKQGSDAAALKAVEELRAEHAAHCQSKERIAKMVVELKDAADRYQLLEKESQVKAMDLEKAMVAAKKARSKIRVAKEELRQAASSVSISHSF